MIKKEFVFLSIFLLGVLILPFVFSFAEPALPSTSSNCTDSDGGENYYLKGVRSFDGNSHEDFCVASDLTESNPVAEEGPYVYEYFCGGEKMYECPLGCQDGACIDNTNVSNTTFFCNDSDGGIIYSVQGITSSSSESFQDVCVNLGSSSFAAKSMNGNYLKEFYCSNDSIEFVYFPCTYGCSNGACIELNVSNSSFLNCSETDNSNDFYVKGITSCSEGVFEDICLNDQNDSSSAGDYLLEYFCKGSEFFGSQVYRCSYGCLEGACLKNAQKSNETFFGKQKDSLGNSFERTDEKIVKERKTFWQAIGNFFSSIFKKSSGFQEGAQCKKGERVPGSTNRCYTGEVSIGGECEIGPCLSSVEGAGTQENPYVFPRDCAILEGSKIYGSENLCYSGEPPSSNEYVCEAVECSEIISAGGMVYEPPQEECKCKGKGKCVADCGYSGQSCTGCECCLCESEAGSGAYQDYQCYEGTSAAANVNANIGDL